jgi:hypothetical protein
VTINRPDIPMGIPETRATRTHTNGYNTVACL